MSDAIEIERLHKRYGRTAAVHELDLRVRPGTVFGLIGPNGAGKTTTLRTLLDVIRPSSGRVRVLGEDPRRGGASLRRRIGYVPGELHLAGRASGHRTLSFYAEVSGSRNSAATLRAARDLADRLGLDLNRPVHTLSKGNKQKVGLIQAFMHSPELLILDEPTSGLDPLVQREFLQMVREAKDAGQTVLLSSHVLSEIQQTADEVAVLASGRVVADGDVASLRLGSVRRVRTQIMTTDSATARAAFDRLPGLHGLELREDAGMLILNGTVNGAIDPFVKALSAFEVHDLSVEEPDLEESVLQLYGGTASAGAAASPVGTASPVGAASRVHPVSRAHPVSPATPHLPADAPSDRRHPGGAWASRRGIGEREHDVPEVSERERGVGEGEHDVPEASERERGVGEGEHDVPEASERERGVEEPERDVPDAGGREEGVADAGEPPTRRSRREREEGR